MYLSLLSRCFIKPPHLAFGLYGNNISKKVFHGKLLSGGYTFNVLSLVKRNYTSSDVYVRDVYLNAKFLRIGEIDTLKEKFNADVLLTARWKVGELNADYVEQVSDLNPDDYWNPEIYINNTTDGLTSTKYKTEHAIKDDGVWFTEKLRFNGNFFEHMELQEFPFDLQCLSLNIMSRKGAKILDDPDLMHRIHLKDFVDESEWHLYNYVKSVQVILQPDLANPDLEVPTLRIECKVSRKSKFYIYNVFIVSLLIGILGFATFAVRSPKVENRLQLVFILILALITLRMSFNSTLPKIAYLTFLDRHLLMSMSCMALICLWHSLVAFFSMASDNTILKRNDHIAGLIILSIYGLVNMKFAVQIFKSPLRNWRVMNLAEKAYIESSKKY